MIRMCYVSTVRALDDNAEAGSVPSHPRRTASPSCRVGTSVPTPKAGDRQSVNGPSAVTAQAPQSSTLGKATAASAD